MLFLEILAPLIIAGVWITGVAILKNGVPVSAPPGIWARLSTYLTTNVAETRDDHPFAELRTRHFDLESDALLARVAAAVDRLGWSRADDVNPTTVRAEVRTPLLGFTDDLEAEVTGVGDGRSILRVRSASRIGRGDLGANAGHILKLFDAVDRVSGQMDGNE